MAAKRFLDDYGHDHGQPNQKRMRKLPSFASVIKEAMKVNFFQNFCSALEPMLRRVVNEEVENGLSRCSSSSSSSRSITRSPSLRNKAPEPSSLQLIFIKKLHLPIFTGSKIVDIDNNQLKLLLVDTKGDGKVPITHPGPIKIEIVVLDGDFPNENQGEKWNNEEFDKNIVKERTGKRPLLTGDLNVTMRDGYGCVGEIEFTDNSSWIRSRKFRVGARVVQMGTSDHQVVKIRGAMTDAFVVKDHRGELYKKHYPPALGDEVWRLEKIGKDGAFHRKLTEAGIKTVQDFLKMFIVHPLKLRMILGNGMSDKIWELITKHARTCSMLNKFYILRGPNYTLILNPICQVVKAVINGQNYSTRDLTGMPRAYIENLVRDAYANWNCLEEVDGLVNETALLTQGDMVDQYQNQQQTMVRSSYQKHEFVSDGSMEVEVGSVVGNNNGQVGCIDWVVNDAYLCSPVDSGAHNFSDTSLDGEFH